MLREVFSNAILHNEKIQHIHVHIRSEASNLCIAVINDGITNSSCEWQPGRGISNLKIRARELGGTLSIEDIPGNKARVSWNVPIRKSGGSDA